ncbi:uncharacterized protein C1orf112 homolog isoform X2 [Tribolium madens]|nr:uncharacterized protein C1orf112 homolog isoform X2 [Tribolium madens]
MKYAIVNFIEIPSLPINVAQIISSTFEYCKFSQGTYSAFYKPVSEIFDVFRRTQEVHIKFLNFLEHHLTFNFSNESEIAAYTEILGVILEISKTLSGVNMKSMADNWKTFIALVQKQSTKNVSSAIQLLTEEIETNLRIASELETNDSKNTIQFFKVAGFLVKVVLKLFEGELEILECYDETLRFWIMIYSWQGSVFQTSKFSDETVDSYKTIVALCTESLLNFIVHYNIFLKKVCTIQENNYVITKDSYGSLVFATTLLKEPHFEKILDENEIVSLIRVIFNLTKNCFVEYFFDSSDFYEELVTSVATAILLFPNVYPELEKMFLECVLQENIWTTLIAVDVWCLVLKYSSEHTCRSVIGVLINKILELKLGSFYSSPAIVHIRILTQRIFKILPVGIQIEELSKCDPNNISIWKIISTRNIPLSHRYCIEFILSDLDDKTCLMDKENYSIADFMLLMETLDILSYTNFNFLEINAGRLVPMLMKLWSFELSEVSLENKSFNYFIPKLLKITSLVGEELTVEHLISILNQLKPVMNTFLLQLLICDFLRWISGRNFNNCLKRNSIFPLITYVFLTLLGSKSAIVVQMALESFTELSNKGNYGTVTQQVSTSSGLVKKLISDYVQTSSAKYDLKYFQLIRNNKFRRRCLDSDASEPNCKKIKLETDVTIDCLKNYTEKLIKMQLNSKQMLEVKSVVQKLQKLV